MTFVHTSATNYLLINRYCCILRVLVRIENEYSKMFSHDGSQKATHVIVFSPKYPNILTSHLIMHIDEKITEKMHKNLATISPFVKLK